MRHLPRIAAAIALAAGPAMVHAAEPSQNARPAAARAKSDVTRGGVGVAQSLEALPGTSVPAAVIGVGGAVGFAALAVGLGSTTTTTSTTGAN